MVTISSLWMAILLSAVFVWIASAIVWMVLPHHKSDYGALPDEEAGRNALGSQKLPPGQYNIPHMSSMAELKTPEGKAKFDNGPVAFLTVVPNGVPPMGIKMVLSFVFFLIVSLLVAYVAGRTLEPGAGYLGVFRVVGAVAWLAYGIAVIQDAIWFGRPWSSVAKTLLDAFIYANITAGTFGWLWPA